MSEVVKSWCGGRGEGGDRVQLGAEYASAAVQERVPT